MADARISDLSAQTSASDDDLLAIVDSPGGTPATNKIKKVNFLRGIAPEMRTVLTTNATITTSVMTNISGLSVKVSAGGIYKFESFLAINRGAAAGIYGYGLTFPAMTNIRGTYFIGTSTVNSPLGTASVRGARTLFDGDSASGSVIVSSISTATLSTYAKIEAIMVVSANGTVQLQAKTSAAANILVFVAGSYMEVVRLN